MFMRKKRMRKLNNILTIFFFFNFNHLTTVFIKEIVTIVIHVCVRFTSKIVTFEYYVIEQ